MAQKSEKAAAIQTAPRAAMAPTATTAGESGSKLAASAAGGTGTVDLSDLLESRLGATQDWLTGASQSTISIQLMGTNDPEQLKDLLNAMGKVVEINKVFVYRTMARQKPSLTVLYGSFDSRRAALEALDKLPPSLRSNRPILRTVQGIRAEIKQHKAS
jgi:septal ring-binding cell division protein DamX